MRIKYDGFENGIASFWKKEVANNAYAATTSTNYAKSGKSSLRMELRNTDDLVGGTFRTEIKIAQEKPLEEHWYSFNILLPNGGTEDYALDPKSQESLAQWHNVPDPGEEWTSPPLALLTNNGHWNIDRYWDDASLSTNSEMEAKGFHEVNDLGSYTNDKGKWVNWKFHIKWGWLKSQNPILEVYKNGVLVLNRDGLPNTMNDKVGVYMKLGIYKWGWAQNSNSILNKRVVYYDEFKMQ